MFLQQHHIFRCFATLKDAYGLVKLVEVYSVLSKRHGDDSLNMLTVDFSSVSIWYTNQPYCTRLGVRCPSISLWIEFLYGQATSL